MDLFTGANGSPNTGPHNNKSFAESGFWRSSAKDTRVRGLELNMPSISVSKAIRLSSVSVACGASKAQSCEQKGSYAPTHPPKRLIENVDFLFKKKSEVFFGLL